MPTPFEPVYGATQALVRSHMHRLPGALKQIGASFTALVPGATETNCFDRAGAQDPKPGTYEMDDPAEVAKEEVKALMPGQDHVITGSLTNTLQVAAGYALPIP